MLFYIYIKTIRGASKKNIYREREREREREVKANIWCKRTPLLIKKGKKAKAKATWLKGKYFEKKT